MSQFRCFRTSSSSSVEVHDGKHRFEHWYLDNQVYFITARCRDRYPAFASDAAKAVFWDRFIITQISMASRPGSPACSTTTTTRSATCA